MDKYQSDLTAIQDDIAVQLTKMEALIMNEIIIEMEGLALSFDRMAGLECNSAEETVRYSAVSKRLNECINILSVMVKKELLK